MRNIKVRSGYMGNMWLRGAVGSPNLYARIIQRAYRKHEVKKVVDSLCISVETNFVDEGWAEVDSTVDALLDGYDSDITLPPSPREDFDEIVPKEALTIVKPIKPVKKPKKSPKKSTKKAPTPPPTHYKARAVKNTSKASKQLEVAQNQNTYFHATTTVKIDGVDVPHKDAKGNLITVDAVTCEARIWKQLVGLSKPIGFKSKVSYPNIRCNRLKHTGCYCKLHNKQVEEGKFWTGNIKVEPVDCNTKEKPCHFKCNQVHTWLGYGTASGLTLPAELQAELKELGYNPETAQTGDFDVGGVVERGSVVNSNH